MNGISILKKPLTLASTLALASALSVGAAIAPAYASDIAYNPNAVITVMADDPTFDVNTQNIDGKVVFGSNVNADAATVEKYLEDNVTIAGRTIKADNDGYTRDVSNVTVSGNTVTFVIGPNTSGMTANFSAEFKLPAVAGSAVAAAMGNKDAETIIGTKLAITQNSATESAANFTVTARAQARSMNHILITDTVENDEGELVEKAIFQGTGTFANGGITIHSHTFQTQTVADYASDIVSVANGIANSGYTFTNNGNGSFTIVNNNGSSANIQVHVYDCNFLNANDLSVGQIFEKEWTNN